MPYSDPAKQKAYKREWARMERAGECGTPSGTTVPVTFRLQTAQDVIDLLQEQVAAIRGDAEAGTLEKAREPKDGVVVGPVSGVVQSRRIVSPGGSRFLVALLLMATSSAAP